MVFDRIKPVALVSQCRNGWGQVRYLVMHFGGTVANSYRNPTLSVGLTRRDAFANLPLLDRPCL